MHHDFMHAMYHTSNKFNRSQVFGFAAAALAISEGQRQV
jgi:hypothetical protein